MNKLWQEHTFLIACSGISLALFSIFAILQLTNSEIMKLGTQWLFVAGVPLLIALVAGGYIGKFKGFGLELESKLRSPVRSLDLKATDAITSLRGDEKESTARLPDFTNDQIERTKRLSFVSGRRQYYGTNAIYRYLKKLRNLDYLEVKRETGEFLCLVPVEEFKKQNDINCNEPVGYSDREIDRFRIALEKNDVCSTYSNTCIDLIVKQDEGLIEVLKKLRNTNKDAAVAVDSEKRFVGLITSSEIERRIADDVLYSRKA